MSVAEIELDFLGTRFSRENRRETWEEKSEMLFRSNRALVCGTKRRRFVVMGPRQRRLRRIRGFLFFCQRSSNICFLQACLVGERHLFWRRQNGVV